MRLLESYGVRDFASEGVLMQDENSLSESTEQSSVLLVYDAEPFWNSSHSPTSPNSYSPGAGPVKDVAGRLFSVVAPCRILVYRSLIDDIISFFYIAEDLSSTGALVVSTASEVGTQAATTLEGALQNKEKRFEAVLNFSAPQIAVTDFKANTPSASGFQSIVVADLGSFVLCNIDAGAYVSPAGIHETAVKEYCKNDKDSGGYESFSVQGHNTAIAVLTLPCEEGFDWNQALGRTTGHRGHFAGGDLNRC